MPYPKLKKPRFSPQRDHVLSLITKTSGHLSAQEVFARAKKEHPKLSQATVYRNLQQLEELHEISAMQGPEGVTYFEAFSEPHHHFVCRICKEIQNLEASNVNICTSCITKKSRVIIEHMVTTLFGVCGKCNSICQD